MKVALKDIGLLLVIIALSGGSGALGVHLFEQNDNPPTPIASVAASSNANLDSANSTSTLSSLVSKVSPAVVSITSESSTYSFFGGPVTEEGS
jgi:S1-C subfamily serine protease